MLVKVAFFHDGPQYRDKNGIIHNGVLNDDIIDGYFYIADSLVSVTRIYAIDRPAQRTEIHHENVTFVEVPNLNCLYGRIFHIKECKKIIEEQVKACDCVIARLPSYVGQYAFEYARKYSKVCLTEVVGCPWDSLWNYSWKGKLLAPLAFYVQKRIVWKSKYVLYETQSFLQKRYPTKGIAEGNSSVKIIEPDTQIVENRLKKINRNSKPIKIATTAAVDVRYKGQQYIIAALGRLKREGNTDFVYELVGGGDQQFLKTIAKKFDVENQVVFKGALSHADVIKWLDTIDIYAQPSRQEGLPRALIEAMSRGIPSFGLRTGGIPELLEKEYIIRRDWHCISDICKLLKTMNSDTMIKQAKRNFKEVQKYNINIVTEKQRRFLDLVKEEKSGQ